jgi:hypothetical protein
MRYTSTLLRFVLVTLQPARCRTKRFIRNDVATYTRRRRLPLLRSVGDWTPDLNRIEAAASAVAAAASADGSRQRIGRRGSAAR